jgi:DNA polymerase-3 subunit alpha
MREINTKNGDRMAFVTLEDMDGTVELTVFPETFRQGGGHLRSGAPLLVRARVEGAGTGSRKLLAEDIRPLAAEAPAGEPALPEACRVWVAGAAGELEEALRAVRAICDRHPGPVPVYLHLQLDDQEVVVRARAVGVRPSPAFAAAVEERLGAGRLRLQ